MDYIRRVIDAFRRVKQPLVDRRKPVVGDNPPELPPGVSVDRRKAPTNGKPSRSK